jgi:hypothetical protein
MAAYTSSLRPHTRGALLQELKELKAAYTTERLELKGALAEAEGRVARLQASLRYDCLPGMTVCKCALGVTASVARLQACLRYDWLLKSMSSYVPK